MLIPSQLKQRHLLLLDSKAFGSTVPESCVRIASWPVQRFGLVLWRARGTIVPKRWLAGSGSGSTADLEAGTHQLQPQLPPGDERNLTIHLVATSYEIVQKIVHVQAKYAAGFCIQ